MEIKVEQIRAARALLDWTQDDLARYSNLSKASIQNYEMGKTEPNAGSLKKIIDTFSLHGVEFTNGGVSRASTVTVLYGASGFEAFLDDVYQTAIKYGTKDDPCCVYLSNVVHENWIKWMGKDKWLNHTTRMIKDKDVMDVRIIVKEGDHHFPANEYAQYKWVPEERFRDKSFYSYHTKLAFLDFANDDVVITVMNQADFAEGYRNHFLDTWDYAATEPTGA